MSESETQRRIVAARLVRRIPALYGHLEAGRITLSTLVRIQNHVTTENAEELVGAVSGLTRDNVDKVLAIRAPRPDVPATLRKLPTHHVAAPSASPTSPPLLAPTMTPSTAGAAASVAATSPSTTDAPLAAPAPARLAKLEPLSESRYRLQLTASEALRDKLERARALMRHRNPSGDLVVIVEAAMDLLVAQLEKERLGATKKPRLQAAPDQRPAAVRSRRVPTATRRAVFARDGERCTFVSGDGQRCAAKTFLELDHIDPYGRDGSHELHNLRVRCRGHNKLYAESSYGRAHIDLRRRKLDDSGKAVEP